MSASVMGLWIEIFGAGKKCGYGESASVMGLWIEIFFQCAYMIGRCVSLCDGAVD